MITKVIQTNSGEVSIQEGGYSDNRKTFALKVTDVWPGGDLSAAPNWPKGARNADIVHFIDYKKYPKATQDAVISPLYTYDEEDKAWYPV